MIYKEKLAMGHGFLMSLWARVAAGVLAFVFLIIGIVGVFIPILPHVLPWVLSIICFKIARIPLISKFFIWLTKPLFLWLRKLTRWADQKWHLGIRKKLADGIRKFRSK